MFAILAILAYYDWLTFALSPPPLARSIVFIFRCYFNSALKFTSVR
jgi:hypothetical protein